MSLQHQRHPGGNATRRGLVLAPVAIILSCSHVLGFASSDAGAEYRLQSSTTEVIRAETEPYQAQLAAYRLASKDDGASGFTPSPQPAATALEKPFAKEVSLAAEAAGIEPGLVHALIEVESAYRPHAVSPKGAVGLMQLLPETAKRYGVSNLTSVPDNLKAGTRHLRSLLDTYGERLDLVLAAYNAGEGAVRKYNNAIPPYRETRDYVPAVLKRYRKAEVPAPVPKNPAIREYMPGTRLDPNALKQLP